MEKLKSFMFITAAVIASCYIIICLLLYLFQDYLLFFPQKLYENSSQIQKYKNVEINIKSNDINLHGWLLNKDAEKLLIYYGGNGDELSMIIPDMNNLDSYAVLLMNYRGYGLSEGRPGEEALFGDALGIYDQITKKLSINGDNIVLCGRSLGSGVAVYVAGKRKVSKLILITPFDSIRNIAKKQFPIFPVGLILKHPFDSITYAKKVSSPMLMIIGGRDKVIPKSNSLNLARNWRGDCRTVVLEKAGHNDIIDYPEFWQAIRDFLNQ